MATEHHLKALKLLVISLAFVLLGGSILLGTMMWKRMNIMRNADMLNASECPGGTLDLRGRGIIIESRTEDQILRLTLEKETGYDEILTIDTCTAKVIGTLIIETDNGLTTN